MERPEQSPPPESGPRLELTDADVYAAMKLIPGYLDITPGDFQEIYRLAFRQAWERLQRATLARDLMTREVAWVGVETPLAEVAAVMGARGFSGVPVLAADGRVAGVISEKDFLRSMEVPEPRNFMRLVAECLASRRCLARPAKKLQAKDLMSAPAVCVAEETPLGDIARLFTARKINRAPVTTPAGRLAGLVSRADIVRAAWGGGRP